jgi:hypothetical protein
MSMSGTSVLAGGSFTTPGASTRRGAALVATATGVATPWNPDVTGGDVRATAVQSNFAWLGGQFTTVGGRARSNLVAACLDTTCQDRLPYDAVLAAPAGPVQWEPSGAARVGDRLYVVNDKTDGTVAAYALPIAPGLNTPVASFTVLPEAGPKWESVRADASGRLLLINANTRNLWRCDPATNCAGAGAPVDVTSAAANATLGAVRVEGVAVNGARTWLATRTSPARMVDDLGTAVSFPVQTLNGQTFALSDAVYANGRYYLTWSYEAGFLSGAAANVIADVAGLLMVVDADAQGRPNPATLRTCRTLRGKPEGVELDGGALVVTFDEDSARKNPQSQSTFPLTQTQDFATRIPVSACN